MYALNLEFQILNDIKMTYIKIKLPLNFAIRGVPKRVCVCDKKQTMMRMTEYITKSKRRI